MKFSNGVCCLLSALVYYNTLEAQFVYDDTRAILQNDDILPQSPWSNLLLNDFWGTSLSHNGSHKSYRPLCTLTFRLNYLFSGYQPFGYHLVNIALNVAATYLFTCLADTVLSTSLGVFISGLLFALHPIHTEAVAGVVGRADLLASIFFLLSLICYNKHRKLRHQSPGPISDGETCDRNGNFFKGRKKQRTSSEASEAGAGSADAQNLVAPATSLLSIFFSGTKQQLQDIQASCCESDHYDKNGNFVKSKKRQQTTFQTSSIQDGRFPKNAFIMSSIAFAAASMFSKEQGITCLGVCFIVDLVYLIKKKSNSSKSTTTKEILRSLATISAATVFLIYIRARAMGFSSPSFAKADNPASASGDLLTRLLTFIYLPVYNFWLLLCPATLSFDWSMGAVPLVQGFIDVRNLVSAAFYSVLAIVLVKVLKRIVQQLFGSEHPLRHSATSKVLVLCLPVMILSFLPASNLFFYVGFVIAERILFIPSIGFCILSGFCIAKVIEKKGRRATFRYLSILLTSILIISFAMKTLTRNKDWQNEENLYRAGIKVNPPKALGNLANVLTQKGRYHEAELAFRKALEFRPNMADVHYNLGVLLQQQRRLTECVSSYKEAINYRPRMALAHLNLAIAYSDLGQKDLSLSILLEVKHISDDGTKDPKSHITTQVSALFNAGKILVELNRPVQAIQVLHQAKKQGESIHYNTQQGILNLLGEAYMLANNTEEAENWFRAALAEKPDHIPAYLTYGKMLAKNKTRQHEAENYFTKAKNLAPNDAGVNLHYGLFLMDQERFYEAAKHFERAATIRPSDYESNFNAGVAFRQSGRNDLAEKFYRKAVEAKPQDPSAHMNLGAMLHLVGKLHEAEERYLNAWRLNPGDQVTRTNIERLHNIMRKQGMRVQQIDEKGTK